MHYGYSLSTRAYEDIRNSHSNENKGRKTANSPCSEKNDGGRMRIFFYTRPLKLQIQVYDRVVVLSIFFSLLMQKFAIVNVKL